MAGFQKQCSQSPFRRQSRRGQSQPARRRKDERQTQTRRTRAANKARMTPVYFQEFGGQLAPRDAPKEWVSWQISGQGSSFLQNPSSRRLRTQNCELRPDHYFLNPNQN